MPASALVLSIAMAIAAGLVGSFAVMRRMTLASDAISHVALPGIGLALAFGIHPAFGAAAALVVGAVLIWGLENRTRIATETLIGVVFSTALAAGSLLASGDELIDALLGSSGSLTQLELLTGLAGAVAVVCFILAARNRLLIALVSPDIARTAGVDVRRLDLLYLFAFALTIALGLRYLGVLLMGSLIIIPAATAKYLARSLRGMLAIAVAAAVFATVAGDTIASWLGRPTGPLIVVVAAAVFFVSVAIRRVP
ncbi:MAG TPA: metal ABC transporter permease [Candidatus Eisenbacteria bacterium]|nr:metal ABC transporter permease [Candidatus Eisenbacteria bacterium]